MQQGNYADLEALVFIPDEIVENQIDPLQTDLYGLTPLERTLKVFEKNGVKHVTFLTENGTTLLEYLKRSSHDWCFTCSCTKKEQLKNLFNSFRLLAPKRGLLICLEPLILDQTIINNMLERLDKQPDEVFKTKNGLLILIGSGPLSHKPTAAWLAEGTFHSNQNAIHLTHSNAICAPVRTRKDLKKIKHALIRNLTKPNDGWVSRHLNRPISTIFSRLLASTQITPNQITLALVVPSLLTGYILAQGGYWGFLIGGALFQLTSILDGVDGELARLKFKSSLYGKWLDFMCDNLAYLAALVGYFIGLFRDGVSDFERTAGWTALLLTVSMMISIIIYYKRFNKDGKLLTVEYSFREKNNWTARFMQWAELLGKREWFALIFFLLAVIGKLEWALIYVCIITAGVLLFSIDAHARASRLGYGE